MTTARAILLVYVVVSLLLCAFPDPGYSKVSSMLVLMSGSAGSLKLAMAYAQDVAYEGREISGELLGVGLTALLIWVCGAFAVRSLGWKENRALKVVFVVMIWVGGALFNLCWFGIRSV